MAAARMSVNRRLARLISGLLAFFAAVGAAHRFMGLSDRSVALAVHTSAPSPALSAHAAWVIGRPPGPAGVLRGHESQPEGGAAAPSPRPHRRGALVAQNMRLPPAGAAPLLVPGACCLGCSPNETESEVP